MNTGNGMKTGNPFSGTGLTMVTRTLGTRLILLTSLLQLYGAKDFNFRLAFLEFSSAKFHKNWKLGYNAVLLYVVLIFSGKSVRPVIEEWEKTNKLPGPWQPLCFSSWKFLSGKYPYNLKILETFTEGKKRTSYLKPNKHGKTHWFRLSQFKT